jgi:beta-lactamase class A
MITVSDNMATNMLIDSFGYDKVNYFCQKIGMHRTKIARKMQDFESLKQGIDNLTSAADVALIYEKFLDEDEFKSPHRTAILQTLADQKLNNKIPARLPSTVKVMHKTGEIPHVEHDAGILEKNGQHLILVVMTSDLVTNQDGIDFCAEIAKKACEKFLN